MRYAITCEHNEVFQHFGKTPAFMFVDIEDDRIVKSELVETQGKGHGALAGFLKEQGTNVVVCGGIGEGARTALASMDIQLISGAKGSLDGIKVALINHSLKDDPSGMCHHHHADEAHTCGHHDCSK